ncbi:cytochrome c [Geomonas silvestris]|uniref:Cytochrome c n=2 Tax=Geomonas silvestris TaxID=2740184 RepID=A0A6V8MKX5_9BACT|nr:cytochrome c [Geomonas silvestris]
MKKQLFITLCIGVLGMVTSINAGAVDAPHVSSCITCHNSTAPTDSNVINGNCLTCHSTTGSSAYKFSNADQGNTSHRWGGSVTNPAAGAQAPADGVLVQGQDYTGSQLACTNCHNPHVNKNTRYLREANDTDQMCFDCHRSRVAPTAATGSHPVLVGYSAAAKAAPAKFVGTTPVNANPSNPTSDLGSKLSADGKVICSTCHGVHGADSRSSNYVNGFKNLSTGDGNLLRTNPRGAAVALGTPDKMNLCTNCHAGKTNHNARGQDIQCLDCHGAHVDYDPNDPTGALGPNIKLIRRNLPGKSKQVFFRYTGSRMEYKNVAGTGVCEGCHTPPASIAEHASTDPRVCSKCHSHNSTAGSFTASCDTCHGNPPTVTKWFDPGTAHPTAYTNCSMCHNTDPSAHQNGVLDVYKTCNGCHGFPPAYANGNPKVNSHGTHSYTCDKCHASTTSNGTTITTPANHMNGTYDLQAGTGATFTYQYSSTGGTCSNVSCHSGNGIIANVAAAKWGTSLGCNGCHGDASSLATYAHAKHVNPATGRGYTCDTCHGATVSGSTNIVNASLHGNGVRDVAAFYNAAAATCTTACHGSVTPNWKTPSTGACGTCHKALSTTTGGLVASNGHGAHYSAAYGPKLDPTSGNSCSACHVYTGELGANHANGVLNLNAGFSTNGACLGCHNQTTNWAGGRVTCESCHATTGGALSVINGITAPDKTLAASQGHGRPGIGQACTGCHDSTSNHISSALGTTNRLLSAYVGALNVECNACHQDSTKVTAASLNMSTHVTVKGGSANMACASCHEPHGSSNISMLRSSINGSTITVSDPINGLVDNVTNRGLCQVCHTLTSHYRAGVPETGHYTSNCLNCHSHNASAGAFKPVGGSCDSCHGYPPAPKMPKLAFGVQGVWSSARFEDYSGGGGAHLVAAHIAPNAKPSEGFANCNMCHNGGRTGSTTYHQMVTPVSTHISNVHVEIDPKFRFGDGFATYTGAKLVNPPARNVTGSCFNVSCHMTKTPRWSIER